MNTECPNCGCDGCDGFCDTRSQLSAPREVLYLSVAKIPGQAQAILVGKTAAELEAEKLQARRFKSLPPEFQRTRIQEYRCEKSRETCGCPVCKAIEKQAETLASKMQKSQLGSFCMDVLSCKEMDLDAGYVSYFWNKSRLSTLGIRF
jgi:hypothetical protein